MRTATNILPGQMSFLDIVVSTQGKKYLLFLEAERDGEKVYRYYAPYDTEAEAREAAENMGKGFVIKHDYV